MVDDEEDTEAVELNKLRTEVDNSNNANYERHLMLIKALRDCGELEELRMRREVLVQLFPLPESVWVEWIEDEKSIMDMDGGIDRVWKVYQLATKDFLSSKIWKEKVLFAIEHFSENTDLVKSVLDKSIIAMGYHTTHGEWFHQQSCKFDSGLHTLKQKVVAPIFLTEKVNTSNYDLKTQDSMKAAQNFVQDEFVKQTEIKLVEIEEKYPPGESYEKKSWVVALWLNIISYTIKKFNGDPVALKRTVCCLFERAIATCFNSTRLWKQYTYYLQYHQYGDLETLESVLNRAVRNCSWSPDLWIAKLILLEQQNNVSLKTTGKVLQDAFASKFDKSEEAYAVILKSCCEVYRRVLFAQKDKNDDKKLVENVQQIYDYAKDTMKISFPRYWQGRLAILESYWHFKITMQLMVDYDKMYQDFIDLIDSSPPSLELFSRSIVMFNNHETHTRKLYKKGMHLLKSGAHREKQNLALSFGKSWENFESTFGTLETLIACRKTIGLSVYYDLANETSHKINDNKTTNKHKSSLSSKSTRSSYKDDGLKKNSSGVRCYNESRKRSRSSSNSDTCKRPRSDSQHRHSMSDNKKDNQRRSSTNDNRNDNRSTSLTNDRRNKSYDNHNRIRNKNYDDNTNSKETSKEEAPGLRMIFVANLPISTTVEQLKNFFGDSCERVRLENSRVSQQPIGKAIVIFKSISFAQKALEIKNGALFNGKKLILSKTRIKRNSENATSEQFDQELIEKVSRRDIEKTVIIHGVPQREISYSGIRRGKFPFFVELQRAGNIDNINISSMNSTILVTYGTVSQAIYASRLSFPQISIRKLQDSDYKSRSYEFSSYNRKQTLGISRSEEKMEKSTEKVAPKDNAYFASLFDL